MWSAVDLFFILSGLLIGGNLLDVRDSPRFFSTFYIRRFCRVLPIYLLSLSVDWLIYHFIVRGPNGFVVGWAFAPVLPWYSYLLFAQNLWMAKWATMGSLGLAMTWAFAVELQFYMVIPAVIRYVRRSALPYIFVSGMVIAPLARLYLVHRSLHNLVATYVLLPCRMDSLCLGLLCAYYLRDPDAWNWLVNHRTRLWAVWCGLFVGIPLLATEGLPFTLLWIAVGYGWMAVLWAITLILGVIGPKSILSRVLSWKGFTGLGIISYGVYLFHIMAYALCMWRSEPSGHLLVSWPDLAVTLISFAITIGFAKLSWRYFEKPILRWGHNWHY